MRRYAVPLLLAGFAVLLVLSLFFQPPLFQDFGPIALQKGEVRSVTFRADYDGNYGVGLRMDQSIAERLAPCWADPMALGDKTCRGSTMPAPFSLRLSESGRDLTPNIVMSSSYPGGVYDSAESFTWSVASMALQKGHSYTLALRSSGRGAALSPANPRLVLDGPLTSEDSAMLFLVVSIASAALLLLSLICAIAIRLRRA